mmetsp:Transcript_49987/g.165525  ORF Transcript_49987/g.165525 Transcript_49987/m.165525 type:complete len:207 (-) Transcript_49987:384-1004(-)
MSTARCSGCRALAKRSHASCPSGSRPTRRARRTSSSRSAGSCAGSRRRRASWLWWRAAHSGSTRRAPRWMRSSPRSASARRTPAEEVAPSRGGGEGRTTRRRAVLPALPLTTCCGCRWPGSPRSVSPDSRRDARQCAARWRSSGQCLPGGCTRRSWLRFAPGSPPFWARRQPTTCRPRETGGRGARCRYTLYRRDSRSESLTHRTS